MKNKKIKTANNNRFFEFNSFLRKNLTLIFCSAFKSFRTYVYVYLIPAALLLALYSYQTYGGIDTPRPPITIGYLLIPGFWIAVLINTLISEWKNSIFLKRINILGTSKFEFLLVIWIVGLVLGISSILFSIAMLFAFMPLINFSPSNSLIEAFAFMGYGSAYEIFEAWGCFILGIIFVLLTSIGIGTLLSGALKSLALTQSLTIILIAICIIMSDLFLSPSMLSGSKVAVGIGYLIPQRYAAWTVFYGVSGGNLEYFILNPNSVATAISFKNLNGPIFGGFGYSIGLILLSYFCFNWNSRG